MDQSAVASNTAREEGIIADKMRLDSFRLGRAMPSTNNNNGPNPRHARSHSRNGSVSVPIAGPAPLVTTTDEPPADSTRNSISKRNSHHRRRSSVSTRRESADMMGVSLPSIAPSTSDDNINLGDKDSIRRRALWTLEGKTDVGTFSKVEIPEFDATETAKRLFEFPSKPSFPPGMGSKRDSLGKFMASASTKEQLHTLVEEEEEEEEIVTSPEQTTPVEVTVTSPSPAPPRRRPASLNLRPLSLVQSTSGDLPTPVLTPSPSARPGLRSLTLASRRHSLILSRSPLPSASSFTRRPSLNMNMNVNAESQSFREPSRRSSISYVCPTNTPPQSVIGLPTPEMTPTSTGESVTEDMQPFLANRPSRPLSTSEQHFLFQAHATLVHRITDLERALSSRSSRSWSRPASCASDTSAASGLSEPSDEMLQLISDLKAERDELKKDVDGWRVRVGDLENQVGMFAKRVQAERRDAWVARERVGLLEVEKCTLEKALEEKASQMKGVQEQLEDARANAESAEEECDKLKKKMERLQGVDDEVVRLKEALEAEKRKREEIERELEHAGLLDTPRAYDVVVPQIPTAVSRTMMFAKRRGLGFQSMDSEGSFTDVDSLDSLRDKHEFRLKAVAEEDEETLSNFSEEDELARFEDEEEGDADAFPPSMSASSFGSVEDDTVSFTKPREDVVETTPPLTRSNTSSSSPIPTPTGKSHSRRASLSKTWTFPTGCEPAQFLGQPEEIDRFFDCLEDVDNSPPLHSQLHSLESSKDLFAQALAEADDELPPFVLPADVGVEVASPETDDPRHVLDVVVEEDEEEEEHINPDDEFVGEVDEGGIKFTFTIPPEYQENSEPESESANTSATFETESSSATAFEPLDEDEDKSFMFPQSRNSSPPSSIPRLTSAKISSIPVPSWNSTPVKTSVLLPRNSNIPSAYMTPPAKRGGASPTSIPQPPSRTPLKTPPSATKIASFIPQPRRVMSPASAKPSAIPVMSPPSTPFSKPLASIPLHPVPSKLPSPSPTMNSHVSPSPDDPFTTSPPVESSAQSPTSLSSFMSMSPTLAARLSFQTLTNFIPMPSLRWSPRSSGTSATAAAALCFIPESPSNSSSGSDGSVQEHGRVNSSFVNSSVGPTNTPPKEKSYVPREAQLEKLRLRMEEERRLRRRGAPNVNAGTSADGVLRI